MVYTVRAVTAGRFTIPPAEAEAMYEPRLSGLGSRHGARSTIHGTLDGQGRKEGSGGGAASEAPSATTQPTQPVHGGEVRRHGTLILTLVR